MIIFTPNTVIKSADVNYNFSNVQDQITEINNRAMMTICFTTSPTNMSFPVAWTYYKVPLNVVQSAYDPNGVLSLNSNGIRIGAGVSYVKVYGYFAFYNSVEADTVVAIRKNSTSVGASAYWNAPSPTDYITAPTSTVVTAVSEGDVFYMYATIGTAGSRNLFNFTSLAVEVVA